MKNGGLVFILITVLFLLTGISGCKTTSTTTSSNLDVPSLKYLLIAEYPDLFWCDPDYYPIAREGQEQQNALEQFASIKADKAEFSAILKHLNLSDNTDYTDLEKLLIYKEHKTLTYGLELTGSSSPYEFILRIGEGQGFRITGTITASGIIKEAKKEASINTCPICLAEGTLIDTPLGAIPVQKLEWGMIVWTRDTAGNRIQAMVLNTIKTPVPFDFRMVKITLRDGRSVTASPGHPAAGGRALGVYHVGDMLDGSVVVSIERVINSDGYTFDVRPAGDTGMYWANGILLISTLN